MNSNSILKPDTIYSHLDGRLVCVHCAGQRALYGDPSDPVEPVDRAETVVWRREFGRDMSCECGRTSYPQPVLRTFKATTTVTGCCEPMVDWFKATDETEARRLWQAEAEACGVPIARASVEFAECDGTLTPLTGKAPA